MAGIGSINLKVLLMDTDFFALQAINSYLAWDRRTRVIEQSDSLEAMWRYIDKTHPSELPDVVVIDANHFGGADTLATAIQRLRESVPNVAIICLAQFIDDPDIINVIVDNQVEALLLKQEVGFQIAWAIVYALKKDFVITHGVGKFTPNHRISGTVLPGQRKYPEMTDRIREAIKLCTVLGMSANLAADEMGISMHTVRGYIREGYRIMESYDDIEYPVDMTPQERAFMRFTALDLPSDELEELG